MVSKKHTPKQTKPPITKPLFILPVLPPTPFGHAPPLPPTPRPHPAPPRGLETLLQYSLTESCPFFSSGTLLPVALNIQAVRITASFELLKYLLFTVCTICLKLSI